VQRARHPRHLTVDRNLDSRPRPHPCLSRADHVEIARRAQATHQSANGHAGETEAGHAPRNAKAQLTLVEPLARPHPEALELIAVVADKDERRVPAPRPPIDLEPHAQNRPPQHGLEDGERKRGPLTKSALPNFLSLAYDLWVHAQTGVVEERPAVHFRDVYVACLTVPQNCYRALEVLRDAQVLREVIQCAAGNEAQDTLAADQALRHGVNRPITTCGNYHVGGVTIHHLRDFLARFNLDERRLQAGIVK